MTIQRETLSSDGSLEPDSAPHNHSRKNKTPMMRISHAFFRLILVVIGIVFLTINWWLGRCCPPISMERANPDTLVGWLIFRDLNKLNAEEQEEILKKYIEHFGPTATSKKSIMFRALTATIKKYTAARTNRVVTWNKDRARLPFLRNEYHLVPNKSKPDIFIGSDEIFPTPELERTLQHRDEMKVPAVKTKAEGNCRMLSKKWFLYKIKQYDATPDEDKKIFLEEAADEMDWWRQYYNEYLSSFRLSQLTEVEVLREFSLLSQSWYQTCEPNELARLLWFKDLLVSISILKRMKISRYEQFIPIQKTATSDFRNFLDQQLHLREPNRSARSIDELEFWEDSDDKPEKALGNQ